METRCKRGVHEPHMEAHRTQLTDAAHERKHILHISSYVVSHFEMHRTKQSAAIQSQILECGGYIFRPAGASGWLVVEVIVLHGVAWKVKSYNIPLLKLGSRRDWLWGTHNNGRLSAINELCKPCAEIRCRAFLFSCGATNPSGPAPTRYRGFTITLRSTHRTR
jgi:hypothetical protein